MTDTIIPITNIELYRLEVAYTSIEDPKIRAEFLRTLESRVADQYADT
ncbi:MAG: hypothetical protein AAGH48_01550 [Pseudomonadota bacterium]